MKNEQAVKAAFEYAAERYAAIGVDVNEVLKKNAGNIFVSALLADRRCFGI